MTSNRVYVGGAVIATVLAISAVFTPGAEAAPGSENAPPAFTPPPRSTLSDNTLKPGFVNLVKQGEAIFTDTQTHASRFVGNRLNCDNCHLYAGRLADSSPLWAAWGMYPAYRGKNKHVNDLPERIQGCFKYSMNGTAPPRGDKVLLALEAYSYGLASGAPVGQALPGRGYPELDKQAKTPDYDREHTPYEQRCALCHNNDGQGQLAADGSQAFPRSGASTPITGAPACNVSARPRLSSRPTCLWARPI